MFEFKNKPHNGKGSPRAVDGFISRRPLSTTLDAQVRQSAAQRRTVSETATMEPDQHLIKAVEHKAALPNFGAAKGIGVGGKKPRTKLRRGFKIAGLTSGFLATCALVIGLFIFGKAWLAAHKIFQGGGNSSTLFSTDVKPEQLRGEGDGRVNVLLTGVGGGDRAGANLTDTIIVASIDPVAKDVALLSIPRDLWVDVPDFWSMKINAAYNSARELAIENGSNEKDASEAGFETLEAVIEDKMGIPIHYHALVNFQAFREGIDTVGGVDVQVEEDLYDYVLAGENNWDPLIAKAGLQHFDGKQALLYAQSRSSSSDFARGERQRAILIALKDKVISNGTFSNPATVASLIDAFGDNVTINATLGEMMRMYEITKDIPSTSIATVGLTDEPNVLVQTDNINDQSIVRPRAGLNDFSEIQSFVRNTLRDPFLKSENASIAVLNGTGIDGLATTKADELKSYGYNVTIVDAAPTTGYQNTVVYDRTGGAKKYTKSYLERRLGVTVTNEPTDSQNPILVSADFIIVLGQDEASKPTN